MMVVDAGHVMARVGGGSRLPTVLVRAREVATSSARAPSPHS